MAYNVPTVDTTRLSFGPARVYIGVEGTTPTVDVGTVKNVSVSVKRTTLDVMQGSPETLVESWAVKEEVTAKCSGLEWDLDNVSYALGAGITTTSVGMTEALEFGGDMGISERAVRLVHIQPGLATIDFQIFRAKGDGSVDIKFDENSAFSMEYTFKAVEANTDFTGQAPAAKKKLFRLLRILP